MSMFNPRGDKVRRAGNSGRVVGKVAKGYDAIATMGPVVGIARRDTEKRVIASMLPARATKTASVLMSQVLSASAA
jgi:hypothetical protein